MIHGKVRFGYALIIAYDTTVQNFLQAYCLGKSPIWNMFLGWRKTDSKGLMYFWIPKKDWSALVKLIFEVYPDLT